MTRVAIAQRKKEQLADITTLLLCLAPCKTYKEKGEMLNRLLIVQDHLDRPGYLQTFAHGLDDESLYVLKAVIAIGQSRLFTVPEGEKVPFEKLAALIESLLSIERFYTKLGGVLGYQQRVYELLLDRDEPKGTKAKFAPPVSVDISRGGTSSLELALCGLSSLGEMAEVYPIGGAADRLGLRDEKTQEALPAAKMLFGGRDLLEGLIRDVQGREYLYYKLYGKQVTTPIVMMTSSAKQGDLHIEEICKRNNWFGRVKDSIRLISQPSVPVITDTGEWVLAAPLEISLKPGGHGAVWHLLEREECFSWLEKNGVAHLLLRQINNPIAGVDYGLMAFMGVGISQGKKFGFASCPRVVHSHEGMNVVKCDQNSINISNVEYCDFAGSGIEDKPEHEGTNTSRFPSNTNILYAHMQSVREKAKKDPFPGLILNFRDKTARLESLMQQISDTFAEPYMPPLSPDRQLEMQTYLTFNKRRKTISAVKREYEPGKEILETPQGCYFDVMHNMEDLLQAKCEMSLPDLPDEETFLRDGPSFICHYHPALGPFYSVISQKIRGGSLAYGSELLLEIAELSMESVDVDGSLVVHAQNVLGPKDDDGVIHYSNECAKCHLKNVIVKNKGVGRKADVDFWQEGHRREEALFIEIEGNGEFIAHDVTFAGNYHILVKDGVRVVAKQKGDEVLFIEEPITTPMSLYSYKVSGNGLIICE